MQRLQATNHSQTPFTMAHGTTRARTGLSSLLLLTNALIWVSAVIVMGIISYFISQSNGTNNSRIIYMEVVVCFIPLCLLGLCG